LETSLVTSLSLPGAPSWALLTGLRARVSRARGVESSTRVRAFVVVALAVLAYHHSLLALTTFLTADTPLAYLGLLPVLVLGVALVKGRPQPGEARLPHRHIDWILGLPFLAAAGFIAVTLPQELSYQYWTYRFDMLGLPFFVAGMTCLLLGSRVLRRIRIPIAALALAWPLPWELGLSRLLAAASSLAVWGVGSMASLVHATREASSTVFVVGSGTDSFHVNIAPQCAGANSALGFLLVGTAFASIAHGKMLRKLLWLIVGTVVVLALNVARILLVFWVGARFGQRAAIDWLHPYIGLVLFTLAIAGLAVLMPRFGLSFFAPARDALDPAPVAPARSPRRNRIRLALATSIALVLGVQNAALARFDPFLGLDSAQAWQSTAPTTRPIPGWTAAKTSRIDWAKPYFGEDSTWDRFTVYHVGTAPMFLDVVNSADLHSFSRFGVEACYRFHGYEILSNSRVDLGGPAPGQSITYADNKSGRVWAVVSWVLPVHAGNHIRYERAVVLQGTSIDRAAQTKARSTVAAFAKSLINRARPQTA
jgi:exosortase/archaeosortase family protein